MVIEDLNAEVNQECMKHFFETDDLNSLIKVPTCYKNPEKPSCIDLLLVNRTKSLSAVDQISIRLTVMKTTFEKRKPRATYFRNWNEICNEKFRTKLLTKLS